MRQRRNDVLPADPTAPPELVPQGLRGQADRLVLRAVPILPPDSRPLVLLDSGNWVTADVNDLYRQLINRGNRLAKLEELHAPLSIIWNERRELQRRADGLWANCLLPSRVAIGDDAGRRFCDCLKLGTGYVLDGGQKRVECAARARVIASPKVPERRVLIPRGIFATLHLHSERPVLVTTSGDEGTLLPAPHDEASS